LKSSLESTKKESSMKKRDAPGEGEDIGKKGMKQRKKKNGGAKNCSIRQLLG